MKQGPCPKCNGRDVYEIEQVIQSDYQSSNATYPTTLTAHYGPSTESGFFGNKNKRTEVGLAAYVCGACGYTELYATALDELGRFAEDGVGNVRKLRR